jgi:hypothetical protein
MRPRAVIERDGDSVVDGQLLECFVSRVEVPLKIWCDSPMVFGIQYAVTREKMNWSTELCTLAWMGEH